jgi:hypothetical protein
MIHNIQLNEVQRYLFAVRTRDGCSCRNFCSWMTASKTKDNGSTTFELMKLKELKEI